MSAFLTTRFQSGGQSQSPNPNRGFEKVHNVGLHVIITKLPSCKAARSLGVCSKWLTEHGRDPRPYCTLFPVPTFNSKRTALFPPGTHWIGEIVQYVLHEGRSDFNRENMKSALETTLVMDPSNVESGVPGYKTYENMTSSSGQRSIPTHCQVDLLPPQIWEKKPKVSHLKNLKKMQKTQNTTIMFLFFNRFILSSLLFPPLVGPHLHSTIPLFIGGLFLRKALGSPYFGWFYIHKQIDKILFGGGGLRLTQNRVNTRKYTDGVTIHYSSFKKAFRGSFTCHYLMFILWKQWACSFFVGGL